MAAIKAECRIRCLPSRRAANKRITAESGWEQVQPAIRSAERAAALTQQLLAFARRQPLSPQALDLNRLVSGMSELLRRTLDETIKIETVLAGGLWPVSVDSSQLESAFLLTIDTQPGLKYYDPETT